MELQVIGTNPGRLPKEEEKEMRVVRWVSRKKNRQEIFSLVLDVGEFNKIQSMRKRFSEMVKPRKLNFDFVQKNAGEIVVVMTVGIPELKAFVENLRQEGIKVRVENRPRLSPKDELGRKALEAFFSEK